MAMESYYSSILWSSKFLWPSEFSYFVNSPTVTSHTQHFPSFPDMCKLQTSSLWTGGGGAWQDQVGLGAGLMRRRQGGLNKSLMQPAAILTVLTPGVQLLSPTAQPMGFNRVWGGATNLQGTILLVLEWGAAWMLALSSVDAGLSSTRTPLALQQFAVPSFSLYPADPDETGSNPTAHSEVIPPEHAWHMLPDQTEVPLHICCLVYSSPCFSSQKWDIPRMHLLSRAPCQPGSVASQSASEVLCCQGCPCHACGAHPWLSFSFVQCWGPRVGSRWSLVAMNP